MSASDRLETVQKGCLGLKLRALPYAMPYSCQNSKLRPDTSDDFLQPERNLSGACDHAPGVPEPHQQPAGISKTLHNNRRQGVLPT